MRMSAYRFTFMLIGLFAFLYLVIPPIVKMLPNFNFEGLRVLGIFVSFLVVFFCFLRPDDTDGL